MNEDGWKQQLLVGTVMLVAVGALIGAIVAVVGIKAANVAGITNGKQAPERLPPQPIARPPSTTSPPPTSPGAASGSVGTTTTKGPASPRHHHLAAGPIVVTARPVSARPMQRVDLVGTYRGHDGTTLQVQNFEGGRWTEFPSSATVSGGGAFTTYIETGRSGPNRFRLLDRATGVASNPVTITIR